MKDIVFMGSKDIGTQCFEYLIKNKNNLNINIKALLTNNKGEKLKQLAKENNIQVINSLSEYLNIKDFDILLSIQYHKILKREHIAKAKDIAINLHMAPLPEYRGCNQFSYAIINKDKEFGTTLHKIDEGIDSGDIIAQKRFNISENIWVNELVNLATTKSYELFCENILNIVDLKFTLTPQKSIQSVKREFHLRDEINSLKQLDLNWSQEKIERHIRATYMPSFEPPYFIISNMKFFIQKEFNENMD